MIERESGDGGSGGGSGDRGRSRAQLVLAAAAVIAIAMVPVALAYLQLGAHPDVRAESEYAEPARDVERLLSRAVHEEALAVNGSRTEPVVVAAFRSNVSTHLDTLREARVDRGTAYEVTYNRSAATEWARNDCPRGPNRDFGACTARQGVVIQDRAGETHVLAAAFDVTITTDRGRVELRLVVRSVGGVAG